jgi:hypothetical protein
MTSEPAGANLIERYLRTRGSRYFRGQHDGEFFYVANTRPRRLHVHLEVCPTHDDVLVIRVTPTCYFPVTERSWLADFADTWNRQDREVTAIVHDSSDPQRIGVVARRSQWIPQSATFADFASLVDGAIADAIDLFGRLTPVAELPATAPPLLRDAS